MAYLAAREFVKLGQSNNWWMSQEFVESQSSMMPAGRQLLVIGENFEMNAQGYVATILLYICAIVSAGLFTWYMYKYQKKQCGWEGALSPSPPHKRLTVLVIYVAFIECAVYIIELMWGHYYPAYLKICKKRTRADHCIYDHHWHGSSHFELNEADFIGSPWLRYCEWLMTCPVIIIALANLTGLKDDYNVRTMALLTTNQAMIVFGVCASFSEGETKAACFVIGCIFGIWLAFMAFLVYAEAYENVPPNSKIIVKYLAFIFFITWTAFPIIFLLGPSTAEALDAQGDIIAHCICDLFSKNAWGFLSLVLRDRVREHHRKLWFEEQARKQAGDKGFDVPKERRPSFRAAVSVFASALGNPDDKYIDPKSKTTAIEDEIDPLYAEYRRRRRLRRGSLSAGGAGQDAVDEDESMVNNQQGDLQKAIQMLQAQQQALQQSMMQQQALGAQSGPQMGFPMAPSPTPVQQPEVLIADPPEGQFGAFFKAQLEAAMGARVTHVRSGDEAFATLRNAAGAGVKYDMLLVAEGFLDRTSLMFVRTSYLVPVVVYGVEFQDPNNLGSDEFLVLPRQDVPYTNDALVGVCRRCMARRNPQAAYRITPVGLSLGGSGSATRERGESSGAVASKDDVAAMLADLAKLRSHAASVIPVTAV